MSEPRTIRLVAEIEVTDKSDMWWTGYLGEMLFCDLKRLRRIDETSSIARVLDVHVQAAQKA